MSRGVPVRRTTSARTSLVNRRRLLVLVAMLGTLTLGAVIGPAWGFEIDKKRTFLGDLWVHGEGTHGIHEQVTADAIRRGMPSAPPNLIAQIQAGAENVDVTHHFDAEYHFDSASVRAYRHRFALGFQRLNEHLNGARPLADLNPEFFRPSFPSYRAIVTALPEALERLADDPGCRGCDRSRLRRLALTLDPTQNDPLGAALLANPNPDPHPPTNPESPFGSVSRISCGLCGKLAGVRDEYLSIMSRVGRAVAFALGQSRRLDQAGGTRRRIERISDALRAYRAFQAIGHAFHGAQDFFAHSNFVELMAGVEVEKPIPDGTRIPVPQGRADFGLAGLQRIMGADRYARLESGAAPAIWLGEGDYCLGSAYNPDTRATFRIPGVIARLLGVPSSLTTPRIGRNHRPPSGLSYCHYPSVTTASGERTPGLNKDSPGVAEPSHVNHTFARQAATDMTAVLWKSFLTTVREPSRGGSGTPPTTTQPATPTPAPVQVVTFTNPQLLDRIKILGYPYEPFRVAACDPAKPGSCTKSDPRSDIRVQARAFCQRNRPSGQPGSRIGSDQSYYALEAPDPGDTTTVPAGTKWVVATNGFVSSSAPGHVFTVIRCLRS